MYIIHTCVYIYVCVYTYMYTVYIYIKYIRHIPNNVCICNICMWALYLIFNRTVKLIKHLKNTEISTKAASSCSCKTSSYPLT